MKARKGNYYIYGGTKGEIRFGIVLSFFDKGFEFSGTFGRLYVGFGKDTMAERQLWGERV